MQGTPLDVASIVCLAGPRRGGLGALGIQFQSLVSSLASSAHCCLCHPSWNPAFSLLAGSQKHRMPTPQCQSIISNWHLVNSSTNGGNLMLATQKKQQLAVALAWEGGLGWWGRLPQEHRHCSELPKARCKSWNQFAKETYGFLSFRVEYWR